MATPKPNLFTWQDVDARSDLDRLYLVRDHLPDEQLVRYLEVMRGRGRDDYPVAAMWNAVLARGFPAPINRSTDSRTGAQSIVAASLRFRCLAGSKETAGADGA